ncbi:hypothetical protein CMUS01_04225 [Colletotrichum musicola]|uniref:Uncharacterized protein n=1 Tax=Colletotrichum musicola TaxID=2175873 RepID=A0A8H6KXS2_9PEZI|nr:hypothetical protein CMUS01_04225 [Colletotrichum musicola]
MTSLKGTRDEGMKGGITHHPSKHTALVAISVDKLLCAGWRGGFFSVGRWEVATAHVTGDGDSLCRHGWIKGQETLFDARGGQRERERDSDQTGLGDDPYDRDTASALTLEEEGGGSGAVTPSSRQHVSSHREITGESAASCGFRPLHDAMPRHATIARPDRSRCPRLEVATPVFSRLSRPCTTCTPSSPVTCPVGSRVPGDNGGNVVQEDGICEPSLRPGRSRRGASVPFHPDLDPMRVNVLLLRHDRCVAGSKSGGRRKTQRVLDSAEPVSSPSRGLGGLVHSRREDEEQDGSKAVEVTNYWGIWRFGAICDASPLRIRGKGSFPGQGNLTSSLVLVF